MDLVENREGIGFISEEFELGPREIASLAYHDIFDYPLNLGELIKWQAGKKFSLRQEKLVINKNGFYFLQGREGVVLKRLLRERISSRKFEIARKIGQILSFIPTIKMLAVTGALAMGNASDSSDIDLLVVSKKGTLWASRLVTLLFLDLLGIPRRKYGEREQADKLCFNIWLDETSLAWNKKNRNVYTAHEICQIIPLVDKDNTYQKFLYLNNWVKDFWPNAVKIDKVEEKKESPGLLAKIFFELCFFFEPVARLFQYKHMQGRKTRETVTQKKALFHPHDWGKIVLSRLTS